MKSTSSKLLKNYGILVEFLGNVLGPDYEIALHEISSDSQSIIAIANGHISGRKVGAPITDFALKMIKDKVYETNDYVLNYKGISKSGKVLRSSTIFIKDENGSLIGMLCINFDASRFTDVSQKILELCNIRQETLKEPEGPLPDVPDALSGAVESFPETVAEMIETVLESCLPGSGILYTDRLTQAEKMHIVDILNKRGFFLLKGAVSQAAKQLKCSEPTIYWYLSALNSDK
ncbi:YheO-like PAS domain protein [Caprobacter fermentans]|uniref:YheO-like PAS domain protein n=1 Tax=Caproicibacter fermentans TaxID=2576756 RepID=A0A6N8HV23_9FIRM|nr:PAS domain-containing protein [Caproicibacter fermentans]MVB09634.1 YheO-like PAS domain protein [Caproicibacter fermentans]